MTKIGSLLLEQATDSERIRTYNFPQNRVTDHRIGLTIQKLDQIMEGKLDEVVDALIMEDQSSRLENADE